MQTEYYQTKPLSTTEIAQLYGITNKTLRRWLKKHMAFIGVRDGRYYTSLQVKVIFERLGVPTIIED